MIINDTRKFHLNEKQGLMVDEQTFGLDFTINSDLTASKENYGTILARKLSSILPPRIKVLEVGPGNGMISVDIVKEFSISHEKIDYETVELSPELSNINALKQVNLSNVTVKIFAEDAHNLANRAGYDLIISNEMAGDLVTIDCVRENDLQTVVEGKQISKWISRYNLPFYRKRNAYNIGAFRIIEQARDILSSEGILFISEHSSEQPILDVYRAGNKHYIQSYKPANDSPSSVNLKTHLEYNLRFSDLVKVAELNGFKLLERGKLIDLVGAKGKMLLLPAFLRFMNDEFDKFISVVRKLPKSAQNPKVAPWYMLMHPEVYDFPTYIPRIDVRECNSQFEYLILRKVK